MSRCPCMPKPVPGAIRSSLITRSGRSPCAAGRDSPRTKAVEGLQPAVIGVAALGGGDESLHSRDLGAGPISTMLAPLTAPFNQTERRGSVAFEATGLDQAAQCGASLRSICSVSVRKVPSTEARSCSLAPWWPGPQGRHGLAVQLVQHGGRRAVRREQGKPGREVDLGQAQLGKGGHVGQHGRARGARGGRMRASCRP